jgi:hypothetical protein
MDVLAWTPRLRLVIVAAALALQVADVMPLRASVRATAARQYENLLRAPVWAGLGRSVDNLIVLPPYQCGPEEAAGGIYNYVYYGKLAALEQLRVNNYYAARYVRSELKAHCVDLLREQLQGALDRRSAYVATDGVRDAWALEGMTSHACQGADGVYLCTPRASGDTAPLVPSQARLYPLGTLLTFRRDADSARPYETLGWRAADADGTWTEGPVAMLRLALAHTADAQRPLSVDVDAQPFVVAGHPRLDVDLVVNGERIARWTYDAASIQTRQSAQIPASVAARRNGLDIVFDIRNPEAPIFVGLNPFHGFLGFEVRSLVVR